MGRVIKVTDGDTVVILDAQKDQHKNRLAGIDAPERGQAFGKRSTQNLARLVDGQQVHVEWHKRDRNGRLVGKVLVGSRDMCLEQVRDGFAWWYQEYANEQTAEDRAAYEAAEQDARASKRGLWADTKPAPPWEWRRVHR